MTHRETPAWMNPKYPCGPECGCYWCWLWGFCGPVPSNWPTASNPAKPAEEKKVEKAEPMLFEPIPE